MIYTDLVLLFLWWEYAGIIRARRGFSANRAGARITCVRTRENAVTMKTGAWVLALLAIAGLIAVVLIDGPLRWLAFGETLMTGFIALGLVVVLALGWGENKPAEIND